MEHIYQASDLSAKRREVMDAARKSIAQIRDTDGTGLVLVTQRKFEFLRALRDHVSRFVTLEGALERPARERRLTDLGELAWLAVFDEDDQRTFRRELLEALVRAVALDSVEPVDACLDEWRRTARALSNEKSRRILTSSGEELGAFEEVERPA